MESRRASKARQSTTAFHRLETTSGGPVRRRKLALYGVLLSIRAPSLADRLTRGLRDATQMTGDVGNPESHLVDLRQRQIQSLRHELASATRIVAFTGAGISTESGIPDFRGKDGIWTRFQPIDFQEFLSSEEARQESWRRKAESDKTLNRAQPNAGHRALAGLHRRGLLSSIITQNIDGLHQASGIPEETVIELHGNATYAACLGCGLRSELEPLYAAFRESGEAPRCGACGGWIKSATISFGQPMPVDEMRRAEAQTLACDLFLVLGTSLVVYPAAGFPRLAKARDARLVIVNREPTDQDSIADLVIHGEIGPILGEAEETLD